MKQACGQQAGIFDGHEQRAEPLQRNNMSNEPPRGKLRDGPNDDRRVCVASFEDQGSFGVLFCVGLEQDFKRLPWLRPAYRATASPMIRRRSWR